jgi:outer membrane cobalamin receptor
MRQILFATAAAMAVASAASAACAQTVQISELVVNARLEESLPEHLAQTGVKVDTIQAEEIRNGGYIDVTQAVQALAPGMTIVSKSGPFDYGDISFQGSRTADVLWMVDGVRINNRLYASTPPLDTIPSAMVERIEVIEGGQSLFYGTQGTAAAVNIVTRAFTDSLKGAVTLGGDDSGGVHGDGYVGNRFGASQVIAYASADVSKGQPAFRASDYRPSATDRDRGYKVYTGGLKYAYTPSDRTRISATAQYTNADLDYLLPYRVAHNVNSRQEFIGTVKIDHQLSDTVDVYLKAYYHRWHTEYDTVYNSLTAPGTTVTLYNNAIWSYDDKGVNALARIKGGPLNYFVGYDFQNYGGKDDVLFIAPSNESTHAVFAQVRTSPELIKNGSLAAGLRYTAPTDGEHSTIWNVSGQYDLSSNLFVRGALGTNFRLPTAEELYADDPFDERGNPNLKPERSKSVNLSVGGKAGALHWEVVGFARDTEDLIDLATYDSVTSQDVFGNISDVVRTRGASVEASTKLGSALTGTVSYTYAKSEIKGTPGQINRIPKQQAKAAVNWQPEGSKFGATLGVAWTGDIFTDVSAPGGADINYGNFAVVNLGARYDFSSYRVNVTIENLLDKEYGRPVKACNDVAESASACSSPYVAQAISLPRTIRATITKNF